MVKIKFLVWETSSGKDIDHTCTSFVWHDMTSDDIKLLQKQFDDFTSKMKVKYKNLQLS